VRYKRATSNRCPRFRPRSALSPLYLLLSRPSRFLGVKLTASFAARRAPRLIQFWVQFEVAVRAAQTRSEHRGGATSRRTGHRWTAALHTQGGNIRTVRIGSVSATLRRGAPPSKLETEGGHSPGSRCRGDLTAFTGAGHSNVGNIAGDLRSQPSLPYPRTSKSDGRDDLNRGATSPSLWLGISSAVDGAGDRFRRSARLGATPRPAGAGFASMLLFSGPWNWNLAAAASV